MPHDPGGKALLAAALKEDGIMAAEQGRLADSMELLDAAQAWKAAARHDRKREKKGPKKSS